MSVTKISKIGAAMIGLALCTLVIAENVVEQSAIDQRVDLVHALESDGNIHGFVQNKSDKPVKNIEVLVHYGWVWADPHAQRSNNPSWADYFTIESELAPGESKAFDYDVGPRLINRTNGRYLRSVTIVGFTPFK
ncbi:MAG: hypothetical protein ACI915_001983 [Gammaproteobacteria bacterium]|jgi:hypothetical protein